MLESTKVISPECSAPLFSASMSACRFVPLRVQASTPTSTLEIRVTDRFGNVYTETMTRPKNFNASVYK